MTGPYKQMKEEWKKVIKLAYSETERSAYKARRALDEIYSLPHDARPNLDRIVPRPGWIEIGPLKWPQEAKDGDWFNYIVPHCNMPDYLAKWVATPRDVFNALRALKKIKTKCDTIVRRLERESEWAMKRWMRKYSRWSKKIEAELAMRALAGSDKT